MYEGGTRRCFERNEVYVIIKTKVNMMDPPTRPPYQHKLATPPRNIARQNSKHNEIIRYWTLHNFMYHQSMLCA